MGNDNTKNRKVNPKNKDKEDQKEERNVNIGHKRTFSLAEPVNYKEIINKQKKIVNDNEIKKETKEEKINESTNNNNKNIERKNTISFNNEPPNILGGNNNKNKEILTEKKHNMKKNLKNKRAYHKNENNNELVNNKNKDVQKDSNLDDIQNFYTESNAFQQSSRDFYPKKIDNKRNINNKNENPLKEKSLKGKKNEKLNPIFKKDYSKKIIRNEKINNERKDNKTFNIEKNNEIDLNNNYKERKKENEKIFHFINQNKRKDNINNSKNVINEKIKINEENNFINHNEINNNIQEISFNNNKNNKIKNEIIINNINIDNINNNINNKINSNLNKNINKNINNNIKINKNYETNNDTYNFKIEIINNNINNNENNNTNNNKNNIINNKNLNNINQINNINITNNFIKEDFNNNKNNIIINNLDNDFKNMKINEVNQNNINDNDENEITVNYNDDEEEIIFAENLNINNIINDQNPNKCSIFKNINIFNSLLIMMNHISFFNEYFSKNNIKIIIDNCNNSNQYCLSSILYYINNYLWNKNDKSIISEKNLLTKYLDFIDCYSRINCNNIDMIDSYCCDINNLELIVDFIYNKINKELTAEKLKSSIINNNNNFFKMNSKLNLFLFEFTKNNKSTISDYFTGFYENQKFCGNCQARNLRFNSNANNNIIEYNYSQFSYISFDLKEISNFYYKKNFGNMNMQYNYFQFNNNNFINYIKLTDCFDYKLNQQNKKEQFYCNKCFLFNIKYEFNLIYILPNVLTIIFNNNENNNVIFEDELDARNYSKKLSGNGKYNVVAILCKFTYNEKFICYCINPNNGLWYSFIDGQINEVQKMDQNSIPLIVIYQLQSTLKFQYVNLLRNNLNKICLNIKFQKGKNPIKLYFDKNSLFTDIYKQISLCANIGDINFSLLINGKKAKLENKLSDILENNQNRVEALVL